MDGRLFVEKDGRQRNHTIVVSCRTCNEQVVSRRDQVRKFCSRICSAKGQRVRVKLNCGYCGRGVEKSPSKASTRTGLVFCSREHKDLAQRLESGIKELHPPHYGTGRHNYREIAYRSARKICVGCGYCELEDMLDVHHVDGDRDNNALGNLAILCVFCHALVTRGYAEMGPDKKIRRKD